MKVKSKVYSFLLIPLMAAMSCSAYITRKEFSTLKYKRTRAAEVKKKFGSPEQEVANRLGSIYHYNRCKRNAWKYLGFLSYIPALGPYLQMANKSRELRMAVTAGKKATGVKRCMAVRLRFNRRGKLIRKSYRWTSR